MDHLDAKLNDILRQLDELKRLVHQLAQPPITKEWYTIPEIAALIHKSAYTVREWCRHGRVKARKKPCGGRGVSGEWLIGHEELKRLLNEGLLPAHGVHPNTV